ncbi:MAG: type I-E CRISPR-associated protein Cse2/CasB [Aggregatilineales bacterium]
MTTKPVQQVWEQKPTEFVNALTRLDAGGLARLRRNAGYTLTEATDVHRVFFQVLPFGLSEWQQDIYFLVATLFPLATHSLSAGTLGATLHRVRVYRDGGGRANSLDRRFQTLIDSDREQLSFRLRQVTRLAEASEKPVNYVRLLVDVLRWDSEAKHVQLRWARDYYIGPNTEDAE